MLNDFVARFALELAGPGCLLFDWTSVRDVRTATGWTIPDGIARDLRRVAEYDRMVTLPFAIFAPNSFMKRAHGAALVTETLPLYDLTHVVDLSGCYIPGHGTPTVLLVGRAQEPRSGRVLLVSGRRGEPSRPEAPECGQAWCSVVGNTRGAPAQDAFSWSRWVSRSALAVHPWSFDDPEWPAAGEGRST